MSDLIERIRRQFDEVVDELQRQQNNINILVVQVNDLTADYAKLYESTERRERDKLAADNERLTAENAALRADAGRYFTLELLAANGDVRIAFDEDGRVGVHLEEAAECADGSWFGDDLAAAVDAATRQITDTDAAIDAMIDSARAKESTAAQTIASPATGSTMASPDSALSVGHAPKD